MKSLHNVVLDWKESGKRGRKYRCGGGFLLTNSISILSRVSSVFDIDIFVSEKARDSTRRYGCPRRANFRFLWRVLLQRNVIGLSFGWRTCQDCHKDTNLVGQHDINSHLFTDRCVTIVWKLELENKAEGVASLHGRRFGRDATKMASRKSSNFCWNRAYVVILSRRISYRVVETYEIS